MAIELFMQQKSAQYQTFKKQQQYVDAQIFNLPTALPLAATPILSY